PSGRKLVTIRTITGNTVSDITRKLVSPRIPTISITPESNESGQLDSQRPIGRIPASGARSCRSITGAPVCQEVYTPAPSVRPKISCSRFADQIYSQPSRPGLLKNPPL